jgi:hypothetical protein
MLKLVYRFYFYRFSNRRINSYYQRVVVRLSNYLLELYYSVSDRITRERRIQNLAHPSLVVSLTSYPARIDKLWLVVESLLDQSRKPDKILVWLYRKEFGSKENLPQNLRRLEERGVEIHFCDDNLYPHKKYLYTMRQYPDADVITVDDDVFYPPTIVEKLISYSDIYPEAVCCFIARDMKMGSETDIQYNEWDYVRCSTPPRHRNQMIGVGGVLYPSGSFDDELFNLDMLKNLSLKTDDLWLKVMLYRNGVRVACMGGAYPKFFIPIIRKADISLQTKNIGEYYNDVNLRKLLDHYGIELDDMVGE